MCTIKQRKPEIRMHDWHKSSATLGKMYMNSCSARVSHISQLLTTSITDKPKSFWTFISKLRQDNQGIGDLHVSGSIVSADALKAEALNEQFNSVYTEEWSMPLPNLGESPYGEIGRLQISISGVLDQLHKLNQSKAQGPDGKFFIPSMIAGTLAVIG